MRTFRAREWTSRTLLWGALLLSSWAVWGQGEVRFEAFCDARQVVLNGYFQVTFTLKNADGTNFSPPDFRDFRILSGPSSSMRTTIVNGVMSREVSYSYTLQPTRTGRFTIGSASIRVRGKTLRTEPIEIEVVEGKAEEDGKSAREEVFVRAEPSTTRAYVGQQILLDLKLYTTLDVDSYSTLEEPAFQGFFVQGLRRSGLRRMQEVIEGVQYSTAVLKRIALFPQQAGLLRIDPITLQLGVVVEDPRQRGFFFRRSIQPLVVRTEPVEIEALPLPPGAPPTFSGAVGRYTFRSTVSPTVLTTDDVVSVKMVMTGDGDAKRLQPPPLLVSPDSFEVYDPNVLEENTYESGGQLLGGKSVEYLLAPRYPGTYTLRPAFSYFDPDSARYVTLYGPRTTLTVRPGRQPIGRSEPAAERPAPPQRDIRSIDTRARWRRQGEGFWGSGLFWGLLGLPLLALGVAFFIRRRRIALENTDPLLLLQRRAARVAQKRLRQAKTHLERGDGSAFFDELSRALYGYVAHKLNLPFSQLSKDNIRQKLEELEVEPATRDALMQVLQTCETALYAGRDRPEIREATYQEALEILTRMERALNDRSA